MIQDYKVKRFEKLFEAKKEQKKHKKIYGYRPEIFKVTKGKKSKYVIVKPKNLKRIDIM